MVWAESAGPYPRAALGERLVRSGLLSQERLALLEAELGPDAPPLDELLRAREEVGSEALNGVEDLVTTDTIFELLRWRTGSFRFSSRPVAHRRDPRSLRPADQILMDGLRMVDEWGTFDRDVLCDDAVFRRVGGFEIFRAAHCDTSPERLAVAERLFLLIDGRLSVRRIVDLSRMSAFDAGQVLSELRRLGLIEPVDPALLARRRRPAAAEFRSRGLPGLRALIVLTPFAALALTAWLAARAPTPAAFPLGGDPVAVAAEAQEVVRARQLARAYRFARGRWPRRLEELSALEARPLATPGGGSYYLRSTRDGVLLLAPERVAGRGR